jgi:GntR family transcriptional regulator
MALTPALKHQRLAAVLADEIRSGAFARNEQLPGELNLAERYKVSRTTVRNALAELNQAGLIATRVGKGSYVLYDGRPLDAREGWARAFDAQGIEGKARVLSISAVDDGSLARRLGRDDTSFVVVKRVRESAGVPISVEISYLPAVGTLRELPTLPIESLSLTEVLAANSLYPDHGTQRITGRLLEADEAEVLKRDISTWFLYMERTTYSTNDSLVEHIECVLDPAHFTFELEVEGPKPLTDR